MIQVRIATSMWRVELVHGWITRDGRMLRGCCDFDRQWIGVSDRLEPDKRQQTCWHELAHAIREELDVEPDRDLSDEAYARLTAMGLMHISPVDLDRMRCYMATGIEAHDVISIRGVGIVPVIGFVG